MFGYIYLTTNLVNGRQYIGQHKGDFDPSYLGSGVILRQAVKKYGRENFTVEVIEWCDDWQTLNEAERRYISSMDNLYNIHPGGTPDSSEISGRLIKYYSRPGTREQHSLIMKDVARDPTVRASLAEASRKRWSRPGEAERQREAMKKVCSSPEAKERLRQAANARWAKTRI
jgi:group I intron endonuclease